MHEDKRIIKTKNHLKATLLKMLENKNFDKITVKDLCETSQTSRITFYTHFDDKYELADSIFKDMVKEIDDNFKSKHSKSSNAEAHDVYCILLNCILDFYYENRRLFNHITLNENQYLYFSFRKYVTDYVAYFAETFSDVIKLKYSPKKISGFLCFGLWGFINMGIEQGSSPTSLKREATEILKNLIVSGVLTEN